MAGSRKVSTMNTTSPNAVARLESSGGNGGKLIVSRCSGISVARAMTEAETESLKSEDNSLLMSPVGLLQLDRFVTHN